MDLSPQQLRSLVAKAMPLSTRLERARAADPQLDAALAETRLARWRQIVAGGDEARFARRLAWDQLDATTVRAALGASPPLEEPLPAWAMTLNAALRAAPAIAARIAGADAERPRCLDPQDPFPFEEAFLPFLDVAIPRLRERVGAAFMQLTPAAQADLERALLARLIKLCNAALVQEFSLYRALRGDRFRRFVAADSASNQLYRAFIHELLTGKLAAFFQEYSVLGRLVGTLTDQWIEAMAELLLRLADDRPALAQLFHAGQDCGALTSVRSDHSDPHRGGRTVAVLTFESGLKLVYKPKDLGLDMCFANLIDWLNGHGLPLALKAPQVLNRSTHGWVAYITRANCDDALAAQRYYRRAGMLLGLVYLLQGNDCHYENLIACGEYPVLIDVETLLHQRQRLASDEDGDGAGGAYQLLEDSVITTGLLPHWEAARAGQIYDNSGLGDVGGQALGIAIPRWHAINTDDMALRYEDHVMRTQANTPLLDGVPLALEAYADELISGFAQLYQLVLEQRDELLAAHGPLAAFADQQVRYILRFTKTYDATIRRALAPTYLRDGADYGIELDIINGPLLYEEQLPAYWSVVAVERQALEQQDIPIFSTRADQDRLDIAGQTLERFFARPAYEWLREHVQRLGPADRERQIGFIRGSLYAHTALPPDSSVPTRATAPDLSASAAVPEDVLFSRALDIAQELEQRAVRADDGAISWIAYGYMPHLRSYQFHGLGYNLYNGVCGVALFLAAVERATGAGYRELALAALQPVRRHLSRADASEIVADIGIGGAAGCGSLIYALVRIGQLLAEPALFADARRAAALITPQQIEADRTLDIVGGTAGAILGLLTLYDLTADDALREQAISGGRHLLAQRTSAPTGQRVWRTVNDRLLTGFSHGAAGIAYALLRLARASGEPQFLAAAQEAIAYEQSLFLPNDANWPDLRHDEPQLMARWCHGASGIGMGRLGGLAVLDTPAIRADIDAALRSTLAWSMDDLDHMCCGNFGRIDFLLSASLRLARPALRDEARARAAFVLAEAGEQRTFRLFDQLPQGVYNPDFFQGTAGIGYELLRLARPELLPSVLLFE